MAFNMNNTQPIGSEDLERKVVMTFAIPNASKIKLSKLSDEEHRSMTQQVVYLIEDAFKSRFGTDDVEVIGKAQS